MPYSAVKDILQEFNLNGIDMIIGTVIILTVVLIYKHFYSSLQKGRSEGLKNIDKCLETYSRVLWSIRNHEKDIIDDNSLLESIYELLPICTYDMKKRIWIGYTKLDSFFKVM